MKVIYKKVRFKNFLSYGKNFTEINLISNKKTAIYGKNGCGKSVILDSITFGLFGKSFRQINKPNLVNSINKKDCLVEIEFSVGAKEYKVVRGIKPNIFEIYQDNILINQDAASKDYQEYLESNIIGTNYKTFIQVVILGSARYIPFMALSAADRRSVLEDLLDIQIFSAMNVIIKERLNTLKSEILEITYKIDLLKEKIKYETNAISNTSKHKEVLIEKKKNDIQNYSNKIEECLTKISTLTNTVEELNNKISHKSAIEAKKNKILSLEAKAEDSMSKLKKQIEFYTHNDNCPTCKQNINDVFRDEKLESATLKKDKLQEGLLKLANDMTDINNKIADFNIIVSNIKTYESEILKLSATMKSNETFVAQLKDELSEMETQETLENSQDNLSMMREQLNGFIEKNDQCINDKKYLEYSATLLKDGGIKTKIVKQYLPVLNKLINFYLSKFQFFVNFTINEKFEEVIKSRHRDAFQYNSFSEGQKTKIDLAILLAFRELSKIKNNVSCNLLLLDEIIDSSLDNESIDLFLDLLDDLDDNTNIFVVSPKAEHVQDRFDRVMSVDLIKNFSKIKYHE